MITLVEFTIAGLPLAGAREDDGSYIVSVPGMEQSFNEVTGVFSRQMKASESLKAFAGKGIQPTKRRVGRTMVNFVSVKDFSCFITWLAINGNQKAQALLSATLRKYA